MTKLQLRLEQLINQAIAERLFPACSIGVVTPSAKFSTCGGTMTYDNPAPVKPDSIFDVASITKSIPTACLALKLLEEGRLGLHDDISKYLDSYQANGDSVTIWNLLTQTVYYDFGYRLSSLRNHPASEILKLIREAPVKVSQTEVTYTNSSSILLGQIIEKIYRKNLAELSHELFFEPLGMKRTGFEPLKLATREEIIPTEIDELRGGLVHAEVHDESTNALAPLVVGSAGMFSTVPDLLIFMEMLLAGGRLGGRRYFKTETVKQMGVNQLSGTNSAGLGWTLNQPGIMGRFAQHSFGKTGFTGCLFLCNPQLKAGLVLLTNHIHPKRLGNFEPINQFRRTIADTVFGSV